MTWWQRLRTRPELERQLDAELRDHLERLVSQHMAEGLSEREARRIAQVEFGGIDQTKEVCRDARGLGVIDTTVDDIRYAWKRLSRNRSLTLTTIVLVAMSVGLSCAVYVFLRSVVLTALPVNNPEQLVLISGVGQSGRIALTPSLFEQVARERQQIMQPFVVRQVYVQGTVGMTTRMLMVVGVAGDYFDALGTSPELGRFLRPDERELAAVISDRLWRSDFAGDPNVIGRPFKLGLTAVPIVGVAGPSFRGTNPRLNWDAILPLEQVGRYALGRPSFPADAPVEVGARLNTGVTRAAYEAHLNAIWPSLLDATIPAGSTLDTWRGRRGTRARVDSLKYGLSYLTENRPGLQRAAVLAFGLSVLILATACVTLALLAVARAVTHQRQIAIMAGLGGTSARVIRTYLLESGIVSITACGIGLLMTAWLLKVGTSLLPSSPGYEWNLRIPSAAIGIAVLMAFITTLVTGLLPGVLAFRGALRNQFQWGAGVVQPHVRLRTCLLALQLALSVLLVHYSLLFLSDLRALSSTELGFKVANLHVYQLLGKLPSRPLDGQYFANLTDRLRGQTGVESAGLISGVAPFIVLNDNSRPVQTDDGGQAQADAMCTFPGVFEALQVARVSGEDFSWSSRPAAIVTESLSRTLFSSTDPLGHTIKTATSKPLPIIGVVKDIAWFGPRLGLRPMVFTPCLGETNSYASNFVLQAFVRSNRTLEDVGRDVQGELDRLGSSQFVSRTRDVVDDLDASVQQERMLATVGGALAILIVLVTGVGLYAFSSYLATLRAREFAIRAALGATRTRISISLLREVTLVVFVGSACGVAATLGLWRAVASTITGVPSPHASDLALGVLIVVSTVAVATIVPTWRTLRLDLARVLRVE